MIKRRQITNDEAILTHEKANQIPVRLISVDVRESLDIAMEFNIYAYDAYFLQGAISMACPLLTLDRRMKQVACELNIKLL